MSISGFPEFSVHSKCECALENSDGTFMSTPESEQSVSAVSYELTMVTTRLSESSCRAVVETMDFLVSLKILVTSFLC